MTGDASVKEGPMGREASDSICSLPEGQLRERIAMLRRDLLPLVKRTVPLPDDAGLALEFDATPALRVQLETLVDFERQCCGGLEWSLSPESDEPHLRLSIAGVAPDASFFKKLGIAAEPTESAEAAGLAEGGIGGAPTGGVSRFAKAGGLGVGAKEAAFLCVQPADQRRRRIVDLLWSLDRNAAAAIGPAPSK